MNYCPDAPWEQTYMKAHSFDKDGLCIFCGNKKTK